MGKDGIDWLIAIKKHPNFRTQHDCKIQDGIDGNSLGNRYSTCNNEVITDVKILVYSHL